MTDDKRIAKLERENAALRSLFVSIAQEIVEIVRRDK